MKFKLFLIITALTCLFTTQAYSQGNSVNGKALYSVCSSCHGTNGLGNKFFGAPRLNSQHAWYLIHQLKNFKTGIRGSHAKDLRGSMMRPMAMTLSTSQEIEDVVAYIMKFKHVELYPE